MLESEERAGAAAVVWPLSGRQWVFLVWTGAAGAAGAAGVTVAAGAAGAAGVAGVTGAAGAAGWSRWSRWYSGNVTGKCVHTTLRVKSDALVLTV